MLYLAHLWLLFYLCGLRAKREEKVGAAPLSVALSLSVFFLLKFTTHKPRHRDGTRPIDHVPVL